MPELLYRANGPNQSVWDRIVATTNLCRGTESTKPFAWPQTPDGAKKGHLWLEAKKLELDLKSGEYSFEPRILS